MGELEEMVEMTVDVAVNVRLDLTAMKEGTLVGILPHLHIMARDHPLLADFSCV